MPVCEPTCFIKDFHPEVNAGIVVDLIVPDSEENWGEDMDEIEKQDEIVPLNMSLETKSIPTSVIEVSLDVSELQTTC